MWAERGDDLKRVIWVVPLSFYAEIVIEFNFSTVFRKHFAPDLHSTGLPRPSSPVCELQAEMATFAHFLPVSHTAVKCLQTVGGVVKVPKNASLDMCRA